MPKWYAARALAEHPIRGIIPPVTTPFDESGDLDERSLAGQCRWLLDGGVHAVTVAGSTGEGHTLSGEEVQRATAAAMQATDGRAPVIAGVIANSTRDVVRRGAALAGLGVAALQVTPVHYLFRPDDDAMLEFFRAATEQASLPVIIYNVVPWSYLAPDLLCRILREVPGVIGVKQSAGDLKLLADLLRQAPSDSLILSAVDALLYPSFALGSHGAVAAILSAAPAACVALWDAVARGDHSRALDLHGRLLSLWNAINGDNLPACVKYVQSLQDCPAGLPRAPMPAADAVQQQAIAAALAALDSAG
jgi:4-hydroxy-tetrahydrodipicolinate synthase